MASDRICSAPPFGHGLTRVQRKVQKRLAQHRRIGIHFDRSVALERQLNAGSLRLGLDDRHRLREEGRQGDGLQFQVLGSRELQEPLDDLVQPTDFAGDHVDVLYGLRRIEAWRARLDAAPPRAETPAATAAVRGVNFCRSNSR